MYKNVVFVSVKLGFYSDLREKSGPFVLLLDKIVENRDGNAWF